MGVRLCINSSRCFPMTATNSVWVFVPRRKPHIDIHGEPHRRQLCGIHGQQVPRCARCPELHLRQRLWQKMFQAPRRCPHEFVDTSVCWLGGAQGIQSAHDRRISHQQSAEALSSLGLRPLVPEHLNASLIQRAMLLVLARRPRQGTNDSTPPAPQLKCWSTAKTSCKGNDVRSGLLDLGTFNLELGGGGARAWVQIQRADTTRRLARRDHHPIRPQKKQYCNHRHNQQHTRQDLKNNFLATNDLTCPFARSSQARASF